MDESTPPSEFYKPKRFKDPIEPFIEDLQDPLTSDFKWIRLKPPPGTLKKGQVIQFLDDLEMGIKEIDTINHRERQLIANWLQLYLKKVEAADFGSGVRKEFAALLDHFLYLMYHVNHSSVQATLDTIQALKMKLGK